MNFVIFHKVVRDNMRNDYFISKSSAQKMFVFGFFLKDDYLSFTKEFREVLDVKSPYLGSGGNSSNFDKKSDDMVEITLEERIFGENPAFEIKRLELLRVMNEWDALRKTGCAYIVIFQDDQGNVTLEPREDVSDLIQGTK